MSIKTKIIRQSLSYTFMWVLVHSFIGLAPFFLYYCRCRMFPSMCFSIEKVVDEGIILFFASTLTGVVALDVYFADYKVKDKFWGLVILVFPVLIFVASVFIFGQLYFEHSSNTNPDYIIINHVQFVIVGLTYLYAITLKMMLFTEEISKGLRYNHLHSLHKQ